MFKFKLDGKQLKPSEVAYHTTYNATWFVVDNIMYKTSFWFIKRGQDTSHKNRLQAFLNGKLIFDGYNL